MLSCWWLDRESGTLRHRLCDPSGAGLPGYANEDGREMSGRVADFTVTHLSRPNPSFFKISLSLKGEEPMERIVSVKSLW